MMEPIRSKDSQGLVLRRFVVLLCFAALVAALLGLASTPWDLAEQVQAQSIPTPSYTPTRGTIPTPTFTPTRTQVCTQVCPTCPPPETPSPTATPVYEGPGVCPPRGYPDYAPNGPPDFDMRQEDWYVTSAVLAWLQPDELAWTHSGPAVAADAVWWLDSKTEYETGSKYELVTNYGPWYDHNELNVPPLVEDLAAKVETDSGGTDLEDMVGGLEHYIQAQGLEGHLAVEKVRGPSYRWIFDDLQENDTFMLLLLGFWQKVDDEWVRVGGHWVGATCFEPYAESVQLVDPLLDEATLGFPGWEYGGVPPTYTMHNDAQFVSYDAYHYVDTEVPGAQWMLEQYAHADLMQVVRNSLGQNYGCLLEPYRGEYQEGQVIRVAIDYAVAIRAGARCYVGMPTPTPGTPTATAIPDPLRISKTRPYGDVYVGWNFYYYIFVTNTSGSAVHDVNVVDTLPDGLAPYSVVPGIGPVGSCNPGGNYDGLHTVTWNLGTLGPGESRSLCVKAQTYSTAAGKILINQAVVSGLGVVSRSASDSAYVYTPNEPTRTPTRVQYPSPTPSPTWGCEFLPCPTCPPPPTPVPTQTPSVGGPGICPRDTYPDYAPHGPPDFDMKQVEQSVKEQWTYSGPAAASGALWWLDSEAEFVNEAKFGLVTSYGPWYDHNELNVPPLLDDVGAMLQTDEWGTSVEQMVSGLEDYIAKQGVETSYVVESILGPSWDWVWLDAQQERTAVLLLLGFWQQDGDEWVRVGGHWTSVCCFSPFGSTFELIDPYFDEAALGFPGREWGGVPYTYTVHNDAQWVSYDDYKFDGTLVPGAHWTPLLYGHDRLGEVVTNSLGQNFGCMLDEYRGPFVDGAAVHVAVDYAVVIRPGALCGGAVIEPTPTSTVSPMPTATETLLPGPTLTNTPEPTVTETLVPGATETLTPVATATATEVPVPSATPSLTPTSMPVIYRLFSPLEIKGWPVTTIHRWHLTRGLLP